MARIDLRHVLGVLLIGCTIAAIIPFDVTFAAISFGKPVARAFILLIMALSGAWAASHAGLRLDGHGARHPWAFGLIGAISVALWVAMLDCWLFRPMLDPSYAKFLHMPLLPRLLYFMPRSFNENIIYRLFVFSIFMLALKRLRVASPVMIIVAMTAAQCINIAANVVIWEPITATSLFYDALRYVAPGVLWAWIYDRFGFSTAEIAAVGCHVFLQPVFSLAFSNSVF